MLKDSAPYGAAKPAINVSKKQSISDEEDGDDSTEGSSDDNDEAMTKTSTGKVGSNSFFFAFFLHFLWEESLHLFWLGNLRFL